jgi:hypothetical protein
MTNTTTTPPEGRSFERPVLRFLERLKQRLCSHRFAIEDLTMVNRDSDGDDRVEWKCSRCWKVFSAHCGLDISPSNGPIYRRGSLPNHQIGGE